jgi:mRNA interferase MazF
MLKKGEGGLPKDCVANISQLITVDKDDLVEKVGTLSPARTRKIIEGIRLLVEPRSIRE